MTELQRAAKNISLQQSAPYEPEILEQTEPSNATMETRVELEKSTTGRGELLHHHYSDVKCVCLLPHLSGPPLISERDV